MIDYKIKAIKRYAEEIEGEFDKKIAEIKSLKETYTKEFGSFEKPIGVTSDFAYLDIKNPPRNKNEIFAEAISIGQTNDKISEHNRELFNKIVRVITETGIPRHVRKTIRRQTKMVDADWYTALYETMPKVVYNSQAVQQRIADIERRITEHQKAVAELAAKQKRDAEAEAVRNKLIRTTAVLAAKYGFDTMTSPNQLMQLLLGKNKYLDLAYAMECTRGDWSQGFYRVENALGDFKIDTDQDKEIYKDVSECLTGDDRDGRIFRDTEWNYSKIYELVDPELLKDFKELEGMFL